MSRGWRKSGLKPGTPVQFETDIFQSGECARERLQSATLIGETETGLLFELDFIDGIGTIYPGRWRYKYFVPWAGIFAGHTKIKANGKEIRAERDVWTTKRDLRAYYGVKEIICGKI